MEWRRGRWRDYRIAKVSRGEVENERQRLALDALRTRLIGRRGLTPGSLNPASRFMYAFRCGQFILIHVSLLEYGYL